MEPLRSVAAYPTNREGWVRTVLLGGLLVFASVLLVPLVLVYGYVVHAIRTTLQGSAEPPAFGNWRQLFVDGLRALVIFLIFLLVPAFVVVLTAVTFESALVSLAEAGDPGAATGGLVAGFALSGVLTVLFTYVAAAAVVNFVREERFAAAFDLRMLRRIVLNREYALAWLTALVVLFVASFVGLIPLVGWLLAPFASFYALVVAGHLWSIGVSAALDSREQAAPARGERPAA